ncbi:NAC domain-containing protein 2-like [Syzygium oleosum]|uniref:NAC domain-containing protein 2-like n=1 Tax=Syzygium oleosum TaxID=219896 RepID=UPI0024BADBBA|nr:NAC domain-containing protein 2-like [Syzygium oleosum]
MHVNRQREVGVVPCTPSSSQELVAAAPSSEDEFPLEFPFGYIFAPTDQELILHYLKPKVMGDPIPLSDLFADVDLYKFDPRKLIENREGVGKDGDEWYFFTPRDRKYPNGSRPNRCTPSGVWKATGKDSIVLMENRTIGYKRLLAFSPSFRGTSQRRSDGTALNMHEYRLEEDEKRIHTSRDEKGVKDKRLDEWVLCKVYTPKHAKHSKNGQKSDHPTKKRNKQNHDQPNGNKDNAPTTAGKNQGQKKAIIVNDGYLQELQSTPNHELNMSQQVDVVDNYQLPQSSQISALGGLENDRPAYNVLSHRNHMHPNVMAHRPSGMRINMHLQVQSVVTQPANLEPPTWQPTGNYPPESHPSRSSCLPAHSTRQNPRQVVVYSFNDLISTNPYHSLPHNR